MNITMLTTGKLTQTTIVLVALACLIVPTTGSARNTSPVCGATITTSTILTADLVNCPGDGIVIGSNGITLDLNGHTVSGDGVPGVSALDIGIRNDGHSEVTIRGGTVKAFDRGVQLDAVTGNRVSRILSTQNSGRGIVLQDGSSGNRVENSNASGNPNRGGIVVDGSNGNVVAGNRTADNDTGIFLVDGASGNLVTANGVTGNLGGGAITLENADRNTISANHVYDNQDGISAVGDGNLLVANLVTDTTGCPPDGCGIGLAVNGGTGNRISGNVVDSTTPQYGIRVDGYEGSAVNTVISDNIVRSAGSDGIAVDVDQVGPVLNTLVSSNLVVGSAHDGIDVATPATTVTRNVVLKNGNLGIEAVPGVTDGGGNRAAGNINPAQCTIVSCSP